MLNPEEIKKTLADKIKQQREQLNYTQEELAQLANLGSAQKVSQIEKAIQNIRADELVRIAKVLFIDIDDLLISPKKTTNTVLWRCEPEIDSDKEKIKADFIQYCNKYNQIESWFGVSSKISWNKCIGKPEDIFDVDDNKLYAKRQAQNIYYQYKLGSKPAFYIKDFLENKLNVKLCFKNLKSFYGNKNIGGSAFCSIGDYGAGILVNSTDADTRINFSLAHELFHLLTWHVIDPDEYSNNSKYRTAVETMANIFASELLLPEETIKEEFDNKMDQKEEGFYLYLINLANNFFVSFNALILRLHYLELLTENPRSYINKYESNYYQYRSFTKQSSKIYNESVSERFLNLLVRAYLEERISIGVISELTGKGIMELKELLANHTDCNEATINEIDFGTIGC